MNSSTTPFREITAPSALTQDIATPPPFGESAQHLAPTCINPSAGRVEYIDIAKGLGLLLTVWAHIVTVGIEYPVIYAFHMPLFFFLSGLVFRREKYATFGTFFTKRVKGLLIPYLIYSFLTWIVWYVYVTATHTAPENTLAPLLQTFIAQGSGGFLVHNVPLWFVACLFVVEMIYYFISALSRAGIILISIAASILGSLMLMDNGYVDFTLLPWSIDVAFCALIFYALGHLITSRWAHRKIIEAVCASKPAWLVFFICLAALCFGGRFNGSISMGHDYIGNALVFYPTAIAGIGAMMILCIRLSRCENALLRYLKLFGKHSFDAMAIHNPVKGVVIPVAAIGLQAIAIQSTNPYVIGGAAFILTLLITCTGMYFVHQFKKYVHREKPLQMRAQS